MLGKEEHTPFRLTYCFLPGILAGIFLVNFVRRQYPEADFGITAQILESACGADMDRAALFAWSWGQRMREALLLAVFSVTWLGTAACGAAAFLYGTGFGVLLASCVAGWGIQGVTLTAASVLPQYLVLAPAWMLLLHWCVENCRGIYGCGAPFAGMKTPALLGRVGKFVLILFLLTVGCALEAYAGPAVLSFVLR